MVDGDGIKLPVEKWRTVHVREHDMDPNGNALVWCRECSVYAWCRVEPKLVNCCKPEQKDTKSALEHVEISPHVRRRRFRTARLERGK